MYDRTGSDARKNANAPAARREGPSSDALDCIRLYSSDARRILKADKGSLQKISKRCILNDQAPQLIFLKASLRNHVTLRDSVSLHFTTSVRGSGE